MQTIFEDKKDEDSQEKELLVGNEFQEVSEAALLEKWDAYAQQLKKESKITLYTIMHSGRPSLQGNTIQIEVENAVQLEELRLGKIDLLNYLRVELKNFALDLHETMVEKSATRKPYTSQEKYQAMLAENPLLEKLRKTFDLDLS